MPRTCLALFARILEISKPLEVPIAFHSQLRPMRQCPMHNTIASTDMISAMDLSRYSGGPREAFAVVFQGGCG